jgi:methyl-accepting chemotaxis protein
MGDLAKGELELGGDINASSNQVSSGAGQIAKGIAQVEAVVQQNAASSEELAATSEQLARQALTLSGIIGFFKVGAALAQRGQSALPSGRLNLTPQRGLAIIAV